MRWHNLGFYLKSSSLEKLRDDRKMTTMTPMTTAHCLRSIRFLNAAVALGQRNT